MRPNILLILTVTLTLAPPLHARTFTRTPLASEVGLDALTRQVSRERVGRELFANPYATVTLGHLDVYDRFPYVESRRFQVVSDPRWSRLVFGEAGRSLRAFDGKGTTLGALSEPRGMAVGEQNRIYVADTGNDRIVVLEASTEFGEIELRPLFAIEGLSRPYDVAHSDGGTPFQPADDLLYVADTGKNRVVALALGPAGARVVAAIGDLGSGPGRFAGPMAIAAGRHGGANTRDVYVADAHNRRLVHLRHDASGLRWVADAPTDAQVLTSLDADAWGNLYAAAPHQGMVQKFNAALAPVAELRDDLHHPKNFHVPFFDVRDHRNGSATRVGQPNGVSIEEWSDLAGMKAWSLGVAVSDLGVVDQNGPAASFHLSDRAAVTLETRDATTGRTIGRRSLGSLDAGAHRMALDDGLRGAAGGSVWLRVTAASTYSEGATDVAETAFDAAGGVTASLPSRPMLIGNTPNPVAAFTRIAFFLPNGSAAVSLAVFDASGRRVRSFGGGFAPGLNEVMWDGTRDGGKRVRPGIYYYRLDVGERRFTRSLALVR